MSILEIVIACGVLLILVLQLILLLRKNTGGNASEILTPINQAFERIERFTGHELGRNREESSQQSRLTREEIGGAVKTELQAYAQTMQQSFKFVSDEQTKYLNSLVDRVNALNQAQATQAEQLREKIETKLSNLQKDNSEQLEKMRVTVDEKLQGTLEKRLSESFQLIGERLDQVHRGLGEMQALASGVGDLKKVLTNVKTRGTWGEVQLGVMLRTNSTF